MKKYLIIIFGLFGLQAFAQQRPQYTQYIFNNYLLNPALSGIENYTDFKAGHRRQWAGINDAPQTTFAAAHLSLGNDYLWKNPLSMPERDDNPMSDDYTQNYTASPAHHGAGAIVFYDKAGPLSTINASLTYAYHLKLAGTLNLSVGVAAGIKRINLDNSKLTFENEGSDPALANTVIVGQTKPDLAMGVWLYGARFFAGASVQQILPNKLSFTTAENLTQGKEVPHAFVTAGYKLYIDDEISFIPSVMVKYMKPVPLSFDANVKFSFKDRFWLGGSYRHKDSYAALAGFNFSKLANLSYSYDLTTSALKNYSSGSHEIVLGLQLNNLYQALGSGRMW